MLVSFNFRISGRIGIKLSLRDTCLLICWWLS